ncbi:MAG: hypothetical protein AAFQ63_17970 [Cyanobacteria bacterium J06621_11]
MGIDLFDPNLSFEDIQKFLENQKKIKLNVTIYREAHQRPSIKTPSAVADACVTSRGFKPIGEKWHSIEANVAIRIITRMLSVSAAYRIKLLDKKIAKQAATRLIDQFGDRTANYLTNTSFASSGDEFSWSPITNSTFDSAVVIYDDRYIGMICMEDED